MRTPLVAFAMCLLTASACVLPARSAPAYEEKAATTADAVLSAVESSRLAIDDAQRRRAFPPTIAVMFDENENDASSAEETLSSIQPPDDASRALHDSLDEIIKPAVDALTDLRILARGGHLDLIGRDEPALAKASKDLNAFLEAHG